MIELWKSIEGWENRYEVSNLGNVRNSKTKTLKIANSSNSGYLRLNFYNGSNIKRFSVHRLVAEAFIPNSENKLDVNHKDGNKQNNHVDNLEWVTRSENLKHAYKHELRKPSTQKLSLDDVKYIKLNPDNLTRKELAERFNVTYWCICDIYQGKSFKDVNCE